MMKHIWILLIAILAMSAIAAIADDSSDCAALQTAADNALRELEAAKKAKRSADLYVLSVLVPNVMQQAREDSHAYDSSEGLSGSPNPANRLGRDNANLQALLRQSRAQRALDAAQAAYDSARGNYGMCVNAHLARYETGPCGHRYMHLFAFNHKPRILFGCGHTDYTCKSNSHKQVTCSDETYSYYGYDGDGVHHTYYATRSGCGRTYWYCKDSASHRASGSTSRVCLSSGSGSSSTRSSSGTTTSPTVQNNGGGTTGGTSSDRVRCGHGRNGNACSRGGWASSREAHKVTCPAGHRYYGCSESGARFHANCRARRSGEVRCARGSLCRSGGYASSRNAHQTTCGRGHTYWSCWPRSVSYHRGH